MTHGEDVAARLDLRQPVDELTRALVDVTSVSGHEDRIAGLVEDALRRVRGLHVWRDGNAVVAQRTTHDGPSVVRLILSRAGTSV